MRTRKRQVESSVKDAKTFARSWTGAWPTATSPPRRRNTGSSEDLLFVHRVDALKLEVQRFSDARAIFRSHPELRAPRELVEAVLQAVE